MNDDHDAALALQLTFFFVFCSFSQQALNFDFELVGQFRASAAVRSVFLLAAASPFVLALVDVLVSIADKARK